MNNKIKLEVAYAADNEQFLITVMMDAGSTVEMAINESGLLAKCKEVDLTKQKIGIFGEPRQLSDKVNAGDRVEIYRPLMIDPKEARRKRK